MTEEKKLPVNKNAQVKQKELKSVKVIAIKKTIEVKEEECSEVVLLGNESILKDVKDIVAEIDSRYNGLKIDEGIDFLSLDEKFEKIISDPSNYQADSQSLTKLTDLENVLNDSYSKFAGDLKGNEIFEKLILNLNTISGIKTRLNNIQQIRQYYQNREKPEEDEELSLVDAIEIIERVSKVEEAENTFKEIKKPVKNEKFIVYGKRDKNSVFDFIDYNKEKDRMEYISTEQEVEKLSKGLDNSAERMGAFNERVDKLIQLDVKDLVKNETKKNTVIQYKIDLNSDLNSFGDYSHESEDYVENSAINVARLSKSILSSINFNIKMIEHYRTDVLGHIDLKMKNKKFPADLKYREVIVRKIDMLTNEIEQYKKLAAKLDKKLDEINNYKSETKPERKPAEKQDILNKFTTLYENLELRDFKLKKVDQIFENEMHELYSDMQTSLGVSNEQHSSQNDTQLLDLISKEGNFSPEEIQKIADSPNVVIEIMKTAMSGQVNGVSLTINQKQNLKEMIQQLAFNFEKQKNKTSQNDKGKKENKVQDVIIEEVQPGQE